MLTRLEQNPSQQELLSALELLSPGTEFREGVNFILEAGTGGILVIGDDPHVLEETESGFQIDCEYTPSRLSELSKMDGAIILSEDLKSIIRANVTLRLNRNVSSRETGMRHQAAEKFSKQTEKVVLAISQRRKMLTLFLKNQRYVFRDLPVVIAGANQTMLALNRYLETLSIAMDRLHRTELSGTVLLADVVTVIQRNEMVRRTENELNRYRIELGVEAQSLQLRPPDLATEIADAFHVIRDYYRVDQRDEEEVYDRISKFDAQLLADRGNISVALGYPRDVAIYMDALEPRGYRLLSQVPRLPMNVIDNVVQTFHTLRAVYEATVEDLQAVEGVGEVRAAMIKDELLRMKFQYRSDDIAYFPRSYQTDEVEKTD